MRPSRSRAAAVAAALVVALSSVGEAAAITWDPPVPVTASGAAVAMPNAMVTFGTSGSLLSYHELDEADVPRVHVRAANGTTTRLSGAEAPAAYWPSLANFRTGVNAVWAHVRTSTRVVKHRSSNDGGKTWGTTATLSGSAEVAGIPRVGRNPSGHVAVVWTDQATGKVRIRVSLDGGATFSSRIALGSTRYQPWDDGWFDAFPAVAVSGGSIVVVYHKDASTIVMRRSTNRGASWSAERTLATDAFGGMPAIHGSGKTILLGYARMSSTDVWTVSRRSTDGGATWGSVTAVARKAAPPSFEPVFSTAGGRWRVLYEQCTSGACERSGASYRESTDGGKTWSDGTRISGTNGYNLPAGLGATAEGPLAAWTRLSVDGTTADVVLRSGTSGTTATTDSASPSTKAETDTGTLEAIRAQALDRLSAPASP